MTLTNQSAPERLIWRTAQHCYNGNCVRVASHDGLILIGDTKDPIGPALAYSREEWDTFVAGVRRGDFDDLP